MRCVAKIVSGVEAAENALTVKSAHSMRTSVRTRAGRELNLEKKDPENVTIPQARAFECDGCGESFTSWERLRQHQVDCKSDDSEDWL